MKYNWKIGGEAGFGIVTSGQLLSRIATRSGYHSYDYMEYPSLIRGGHNTIEVIISDEPVHASVWLVDFLVCLNKETFTLHSHRLHAGSIVVFDPDEFQPEGDFAKVPVPFKKIKQEEKITQQMVNTVAIAASLTLLGGHVDIFEDSIRKQFARKGQEVVDINIKIVKIGQDYALKSGVQPLHVLAQRDGQETKAVMTGNDMFSLATVVADCRFYGAYPMTPASSVMMTLAAWQAKTGMIVRHAEDEIAAINSALGSSFAGVRSAVGTSGGGFALMVEALSYSGVAEIPIVVFLSMRPGPATGLPTWTGQGDLLFAVHGGHGEFPKIVLAPGDIQEMAEIGLKAFDLADLYQTPVIVLSDKLLSESNESISSKLLAEIFHKYNPNRAKIVSHTDQAPYLRYKDSADGISEMLIPGQEGQYYQANSYEHIEDSHTTEDGGATKQQVEKRTRKIQGYIQNHFALPKQYGNLDAQTVIVSWGSMKGIILEAQKILKDKHQQDTSFIHFTHLYPIDEAKVKDMLKITEGKRYILVENNAHAQFGQLLRMQTSIDISEKLLKYDGRPFWPEEIVSHILNTK